MTTPPTPVEDTAALDYDAETREQWLDEPDELPRRPRRKLLAPVPAVLLVVLLIAGAFFAGVEVQKGQGSSSSAGGLPAGLAALRGGGGAGALKSARSGAGGGAGGSFGGSGFLGGGALSGQLTTGEVSYVSGSTLYVTNAEGNTVKVGAPAGTKVSKTVSTSVHSIHPGDTVVVRGSRSGNGGVTASSISISSAGSTAGSSGSSSSSGSSGARATPQLFGSG